MVLNQIIARAAPAIRGVLKPGSEALGRVVKRLGLGAGATVDTVIKAARQNPLTAAFMAYELGDVGRSIIVELSDSYPEMVSDIEAIGYKHDEVEQETPLSDLEKYADELAILDDVSAFLGGDTNMYAFFNAVAMVKENRNLLVLREKVRALSRR
jgi:hypothetical protein